MPTGNVVLSEHQHELVEALVQSRRYQNASEVLREGLRIIEQRERIKQAKLKALQQAAARRWRWWLVPIDSGPTAAPLKPRFARPRAAAVRSAAPSAPAPPGWG